MAESMLYILEMAPLFWGLISRITSRKYSWAAGIVVILLHVSVRVCLITFLPVGET